MPVHLLRNGKPISEASSNFKGQLDQKIDEIDLLVQLTFKI